MIAKVYAKLARKTEIIFTFNTFHLHLENSPVTRRTLKQTQTILHASLKHNRISKNINF